MSFQTIPYVCGTLADVRDMFILKCVVYIRHSQTKEKNVPEATNFPVIPGTSPPPPPHCQSACSLNCTSDLMRFFIGVHQWRVFLRAGHEW